MYQLSVYIHILSAIVWIGGMFFLTLVGVPALRPLPAVERGRLLGLLAFRFRTVGWVSLGLLIITGVINTTYRGVTWELIFSGEFFQSTFGQALSYKLALVTAILVMSVVHDFVIGPISVRLLEDPATATGPRTAALRRQASWLARLNMLFALLVVALGVVLVRGLPA